MAVMANAQTNYSRNEKGELYVFDNEMVDETYWYSFDHVSGNGKYAVGYDDIFSYSSFFWQLDKPEELQCLNKDPYGVYAFDVTNDGMIVGGWRDADGYLMPAYKKLGGSWEVLPVPADYDFENIARWDHSIRHGVKAVTPDGKVMVGVCYYGSRSTANKSYRLWPIRWVLDENTGKYEIDEEFGKKIRTSGINECMIYDISNDGNLMVGMTTAGSGGHQPTIIKADGTVNVLFKGGEEQTGEETEESYFFGGGYCNHVDAEGNVYGYVDLPVTEEYSKMYFFVVEAGSDKAVINENEDIVCANAGRRIDFSRSNYMYSPLDISDDGKVLAGGAVASIQGLGMVNIPAIYVFDTEGPDGIKPVFNKDVKISLSGNNLVVCGSYDNAKVYDTTGKLIASGEQGKILNLGSASGAYIVNVKKDGQTSSYKFVK